MMYNAHKPEIEIGQQTNGRMFKSEAVDYIEKVAIECDIPYEDLMQFAHEWHDGKENLCHYDVPERYDLPDPKMFWIAFSVITGKELPKDLDMAWRCAC